MPERTTQNAQTLLSPRVPRDTEHERYHPELEEELKECLFCLKRNEMMFDMEVDTDLIEQRIYERQALPLPVLTGARPGAGAAHGAYPLPAHGRVKRLSEKILTKAALRDILLQDKSVPELCPAR